MGQAKGTQAVNEVNQAMADIESAKSDAEFAAQAIHDLEEEILRTASPASALHKHSARLEEAQQAFHAARDAVLNSPTYKREYDRARLSGNGADLARIRQDALDHSQEYKVAQRVYDAAKSLHEQARIQALQADPRWEKAVQESREARQRLAQAEQLLKSSLIRKSSAAAVYRQAASVGSAAQATIQKGMQEVKRLEQQQKSLNQQPKRSGSSGKRSR
jgi:hypothetical protein